MAVCEIHLNYVESIGKMTSLTAILPENLGKGPFPVLYLLHGLSDDHTAWTRRTSLERYLEGLPLIVIMPNGERSFYTDAESLSNAAFETLITRDIINFVDNTFNTIATREGRVIAGLSMGGYGAVKLALKHPDLFRAAVSHSGALEFAAHPLREIKERDNRGNEWLREFIPIVGENPQGGANDCFALAERFALNERSISKIPSESSTRNAEILSPALRIDCGTEDFLLEHSRSFHAHLQKLGIAHQYEEHSGDHNWQYWDEHIKETIAFLATQLKLSRSS